MLNVSENFELFKVVIFGLIIPSSGVIDFVGFTLEVDSGTKSFNIFKNLYLLICSLQPKWKIVLLSLALIMHSMALLTCSRCNGLNIKSLKYSQ